MSIVKIKDKQFEIFINEEEILTAVKQIGKRISEDMKDKNPLFICVLNGAFMFASDLMKCLDFPCEITFIRLKSYQGMSAQGGVKEIHGLIESIEDRHVVVVEDIVDTGHTIRHLMEKIQTERPKSLKVAALLFKPASLQTGIIPDYVAMEIPNDFIVGYGLDYDGEGRNLRNIYKVKS